MLQPILVLYGAGVGLAIGQLTGTILSDIPRQNAGMGSGGSSTVRHLWSALGIALIGGVLTIQIAASGTAALSAATQIPAAIRPTIQMRSIRASAAVSPPSRASRRDRSPRPSPLCSTKQLRSDSQRRLSCRNLLRPWCNNVAFDSEAQARNRLGSKALGTDRGRPNGCRRTVLRRMIPTSLLQEEIRCSQLCPCVID